MPSGWPCAPDRFNLFARPSTWRGGWTQAMCYPLLIQSPGSQSGHFQTTFASKTSINSTCLLSTFTTTDDPNQAFNSFFYPHVFVAVHSSSNCSACGKIGRAHV